MMLKKYSALKILIIIVCVTQSTMSYAAKNWHEASGLELQQLPPFCQSWYKAYRGREASPRDMQQFQSWRQRLGGIPDPQHLCPGLYALNYSYQFSKKSRDRAYALQAATNELSYVLKYNPKFPIRSTVLLKRGKAFEEWDKLDKAMADYQEAMHIKPNNTRAYTAVAGIYLKLNNKTEALNIINQGLKIKPKSKLLLNFKKRIGK